MNRDAPRIRGELSSRLPIAASLLSLATLLAACGTNDSAIEDARNAAPMETSVQSPRSQAPEPANDLESSDADPSENSGPLGAPSKGTRVCVTNETGAASYDDPEPWIYWRDYDTETNWGSLPRHATFCAEGTSFLDQDVTLKLSGYGSFPQDVTVYFRNPIYGYPNVDVRENRASSLDRCLDKGFDVGESMTIVFMEPPWYVKIERKADTRWKEFEVTLRRGLDFQRSKCQVVNV